jgi:hypothetical protein
MSRIFISYSHKDEEWKNRLESQLNVLKSKGLSTWTFRQIEAGKDWWKETKEALHNAKVAVLLISADFLNSGFIAEKEVPVLLERRLEEGLVVIPIIARPCPWKKIEWLAGIQARPKDSKPLSMHNEAEIEETLSEIAIEIFEIINTNGEVKIQPQPGVTTQKEGDEGQVGPPNPHNEVNIKCQGQPVWEWLTPKGIYLQTEENEWIYWIGQSGNFYSSFLLRTSSSAVMDEKNRLVVGLYEERAARFDGNQLEYIPWNHPILSMSRTGIGIVVGDSGGNIGLFEKQRKTILNIKLQEPVTDIININDERLAVLGAKGSFWIAEWPFDRGAQMKSVDITDIEHVFGLVESNIHGCVLLMGVSRVVIMDCETGKMRAVSCILEGSIRSVYPNYGRSGGCAILTDEGELYILSDDLKTENKIKFTADEGRIAGIRPLSKGGFLAWTTEGNLYRVKENFTINQIAADQVTMAFPDLNDVGIYIVRWYGLEGVSIQYELNRS